MHRSRRRLISAAFVALLGTVAASTRAQDSAPGGEQAPVAIDSDAAAKAAEAKAAEAKAAEVKLDAELKRLAAALGEVTTLVASFTQSKYLEVFESEVITKGTLSLATESRLRWEFTDPVKSVLIVNGDRGRRERVSRKGVKTVTSFALADDPVAAATAQQVVLWTRGEFEKARKSYELELVATTPLTIVAKAKDPLVAKVVSSVRLRFADDLRSLAEVTLTETGGAKTVITFTNVRRGDKLDAELFRVTYE